MNNLNADPLICKVFTNFFKEKEHCRIEFLCNLLRNCSPLELRYYSTFLDNLCRYDNNYLRPENCDKDPPHLTELKQMLLKNEENQIPAPFYALINKEAIRKKLILDLSLLQSKNYSFSKLIYEALMADVLENDPSHPLYILNSNGSQKSPRFAPTIIVLAKLDWQALEECLVIYTLAIHHPAFSFEQQQRLFSRLCDMNSWYSMCTRLNKLQFSKFTNPSSDSHKYAISNISLKSRPKILPLRSLSCGSLAYSIALNSFAKPYKADSYLYSPSSHSNNQKNFFLNSEPNEECHGLLRSNSDSIITQLSSEFPYNTVNFSKKQSRRKCINSSNIIKDQKITSLSFKNDRDTFPRHSNKKIDHQSYISTMPIAQPNENPCYSEKKKTKNPCFSLNRSHSRSYHRQNRFCEPLLLPRRHSSASSHLSTPPSEELSSGPNYCSSNGSSTESTNKSQLITDLSKISCSALATGDIHFPPLPSSLNLRRSRSPTRLLNESNSSPCHSSNSNKGTNKSCLSIKSDQKTNEYRTNELFEDSASADITNSNKIPGQIDSVKPNNVYTPSQSVNWPLPGTSMSNGINPHGSFIYSPVCALRTSSEYCPREYFSSGQPHFFISMAPTSYVAPPKDLNEMQDMYEFPNLPVSAMSSQESTGEGLTTSDPLQNCATSLSSENNLLKTVGSSTRPSSIFNSTSSEALENGNHSLSKTMKPTPYSTIYLPSTIPVPNPYLASASAFPFGLVHQGALAFSTGQTCLPHMPMQTWFQNPTLNLGPSQLIGRASQVGPSTQMPTPNPGVYPTVHSSSTTVPDSIVDSNAHSFTESNGNATQSTRTSTPDADDKSSNVAHSDGATTPTSQFQEIDPNVAMALLSIGTNNSFFYNPAMSQMVPPQHHNFIPNSMANLQYFGPPPMQGQAYGNFSPMSNPPGIFVLPPSTNQAYSNSGPRNFSNPQYQNRNQMPFQMLNTSDRPNKVCFNCGKLGHKSAQCSQRRN